MTRILRFTLSILGIAVFFGAVQLRGTSARLRNDIVEDVDRFYLPPANWLQVFCLGYNEAFADLIWLKTVVYFGEQAGTSWARGIKDNFTLNYLATATELDPKFKALYTQGSVLTQYQRGELTLETALMAIDILEKGVREFPNDGEIAFRLGFMHYYEIQLFKENDDTSKYLEYKEKGIRIIRRAALMDNVPKYVTLLSSSLLHKAGMRDLVIEHLQQLLIKETNPEIRHSLEQQLIRELGEAAQRDILAGRRLQERWHQNLPFAEFDLYLILFNGSDERPDELLDPLHQANRALGIVEQPEPDAVSL